MHERSSRQSSGGAPGLGSPSERVSATRTPTRLGHHVQNAPVVSLGPIHLMRRLLHNALDQESGSCATTHPIIRTRSESPDRQLCPTLCPP